MLLCWFTDENGNRMWTLFLLYILGLNICQTTGNDNSTQMYYFKLEIEKSAKANLTERLTPFVSNTTLRVDAITMTTICETLVAGTACSCEPNFRWSDSVCQEYRCCNKTCTFRKGSPRMCVSNEAVVVNGSITLSGVDYYTCLEENTSEKFKQCNNKLLLEMKRVYSTLRGFDSLTINKYRVGSVIADFQIFFADKIQPKQLTEKSELLNRNLSDSSMVINTTGVVHLTMPPNNSVCYYDKPKLTCTLKEDLNTTPVWQLRRDGTVFEIFNGTESNVSTTTLKTSVTLLNISDLWKGEYTCVFNTTSGSIQILHKASAVLNISLLPSIEMTMAPSFPRCSNGSDFVSVRVKCTPQSNQDMYDVTWTGHNLVAGPFPESDDVHTKAVVVSCNENKNPSVTCTFKNKCNEERIASAIVNVIYGTSQFCTAESDWEDTKAGFTAVLKCSNMTGQRQRKCSEQGSWESEVSTCVKQEVNNVLQKAKIVDIGLGSLHENTAAVFSHLEKVTNTSATINTVADMSASVEVLSQLSHRIKNISNESTANDFLESSSNMLEKSLNKSWTTETEKSNISLAETYLRSVEDLIQMTNLISVLKKKNVELNTSNCTLESCQGKVFDTNIVLVSRNTGSVKTAGFQELQNYLPQKNETYEPNSMVVSITTSVKQLDSIEVHINFSLIKPRPRNVDIKCVAWDNNTRSWSCDGCKWSGASNEGLCICSHLSSFAILMAKDPVDIPGLKELTLVGLSVSVISLILTLVIELISWSAVVKTDSLYLRHTSNVNICLCLLVADCCFLASFKLDDDYQEMWCRIFVLLKHFCYLSMFFWMFCQSSMLLHQAIFPFHSMSRKAYLRFSLVLGYVCPLLISVITLLIYNNGAEGEYFSKDTCWLHYAGLMKGSIHTFVIPIGVIVFFNVFSMVVVIIKILDRPTNSGKYNENERKAAITVLRTVILLTPIFGVTWVFGFAVMLLDLTSGVIVTIVHFAFNLLNTFQGLFILLTTCLADKLTREALLKHLKKNAPASTTDSTTKLDSTWK